MCDPVTIATVTAVVGTTIGATAAIQQGQAAKAQGRYQAAVARNNEIRAKHAATDAKERGAQAEAQHRQRIRQIIGAQRAGAAARGVTVDSGSALDQTVDTAGFGEFDALMIRSNADREAQGYLQEGANFAGEARLRDSAASSAMTGAYLDATGTLLSGTSGVADRWYKLRGPSDA